MILERVREMRESAPCTQQAIADYLHVSRRAYNSYENGKRDWPLEILSSLADYFGTSLDYLTNRTDQTEPYPKSKRRM